MKFFNTAGPVNQEEHYKLDPLTRWNLEEILSLIEQKKYFILHAPRQTGKTSCLLALRDYLNKEDKYACIYCNFEVGQSARNNVKDGMAAIISELNKQCSFVLSEYNKIQNITKFVESAGYHDALNSFLSKVSIDSPKPIILFIDEIDALIGDTLISVLRQLRSGYSDRPKAFPQTIILCGVRDIKDYRIHRSDDDVITGGSAFNIKAKSLTLGNFSELEVRELYYEHTKETG